MLLHRLKFLRGLQYCSVDWVGESDEGELIDQVHSSAMRQYSSRQAEEHPK
jgi:hypothetical protein